jgi:hypothetical protein
MIVLIIGLTMLFNSYIIPGPKRDILLKTIKIIETKVEVDGKSLSQEDFKKLEEVQQHIEEIDTNQEEKDMVQNFCFCFEGFCRHKCFIFNCLALLLFSIIISTILAMVLSAALLTKYGNIKKDIC